MPDETKRHPDLDAFDEALAAYEAQADGDRAGAGEDLAIARISAIAKAAGYSFGMLTDGTIVLEPPADPNCCGVCAEAALAEFKQLGHVER
ncbi:hypothetical protein [Mycolicibacterium komossense]|uniref:Uncharacterized protein n=1 Tax=Mycolicibacterium komossense TaxID=1779 RepID=A0ABT3C9H5_9MYCO|nr:hypothetical protein [Mycolicibacterium komossense]MCV7226085.1 hypothetical protein [Mycolicibacterium komossense]